MQRNAQNKSSNACCIVLVLRDGAVYLYLHLCDMILQLLGAILKSDSLWNGLRRV